MSAALVLFAPALVDSADRRGSDLIVVRRPALRSYTGRASGNVDERLCIAVEAYEAGGETECVGVDGDGRPVFGGRRLPKHVEVVWCSDDERERWDRGTGGEPGRPRSDTSNPIIAYLTADARAVGAAIGRAQATLRAGSGAPAPSEPVVEMTSLAALLADALERVRARRPDLSDAEIARAAGLEPAAISRARHACRESTLGRVLAAVADLTGERLDIGLVPRP